MMAALTHNSCRGRVLAAPKQCWQCGQLQFWWQTTYRLASNCEAL